MDEVLLSVSKIPSYDILESLYKLRKRESAQLRIVRHGDIHQKISMPNYQKLKTMVTSIAKLRRQARDN